MPVEVVSCLAFAATASVLWVIASLRAAGDPVDGARRRRMATLGLTAVITGGVAQIVFRDVLSAGALLCILAGLVALYMGVFGRH